MKYDIIELTEQEAIDIISPEVSVKEGDYVPLDLFWVRGDN